MSDRESQFENITPGILISNISKANGFYKLLSENRSECRNTESVLDFRDDIVCSCRFASWINEVTSTLGLIEIGNTPIDTDQPRFDFNVFKSKRERPWLVTNSSVFFHFCQSSGLCFYDILLVVNRHDFYIFMKQGRSISISTGTFIKAAAIGLSVWFLWYVREIVAIFLVALMLASLIDPFADWFSKKNVPRGLAVLIVYTILLAITTIIIIMIMPILVDQSIQLLSNLSVFSSDVSATVSKFQSFSAQHGLEQNVTASLQSLQSGISESFISFFTTVKGFFGSIAALFIILVLTFYMVIEEGKMQKYFKSLVPVEYRPYFTDILLKMQKKIGEWLRGQIILGFFVGVAVYIGLKIIGVDYALLLAIIAGLFEIIPYVGPIVSLVPAAIIGFAQSPVIGIAVVILFLIIQQIENNLLVPKVMEKVTGLNPIISIAAILVGVKVGGIVGAIFAIPIATMAAVILEDVFKEYS